MVRPWEWLIDLLCFWRASEVWTAGQKLIDGLRNGGNGEIFSNSIGAP